MNQLLYFQSYVMIPHIIENLYQYHGRILVNFNELRALNIRPWKNLAACHWRLWIVRD